MDINIVKMVAEHIPYLAEIENVCFSVPWSEKGISDELNNSHARFFVALVGGKVAGYIGAHNVVGQVYITNVAVLPEHRCGGIGTALIKHLVDVSKSENAEFVTLEVRVSNAKAISLYSKMNFKEVGKRTNFYDNPREDALLMTCFLDGEV